ncbi:MAG: hypothetical protein H0X13_17830 [Ramlibacter sp.]|nr:hypothetical protein [Ramlibacter sp.]
MALARRTIRILETEFCIEGDSQLHDYVDAFGLAYAAQGPVSPPHSKVDVDVVCRSIAQGDHGAFAQIHSSATHEHWNFGGERELLSDGSVAIYIPSRHAKVTLQSDSMRLLVEASPAASPIGIGQLVFHICRNLSLYLRDRQRGWQLHASAVEVGGKAVLFVGDQGAGKSTLFLQSVLAGPCRPLANDRVLVLNNADLIVRSWPGYLSMCEGSILRHGALVEASEAYESGGYPYAFLHWPTELKSVFTKGPDTKRMYPMTWFTQAANKMYIEEAPLGCIAFVHVSPEAKTSVKWLDPRNLGAARETLERNHFDLIETSFSSWHGLPLSGEPLGIGALLSAMEQGGVPVVDMTVAVRDLPLISELVEQSHSSSRGHTSADDSALPSLFGADHASLACKRKA